MKSIEDKAEKLYSDSLPYHTYEHVLDILETAMDFVWACFSFGVRVDAQIVYYAILFHDAGYHEDQSEKGFATKEEYSAHLARRTLSEYDFSEDIIGEVEKCIMGTHVDSSLETLEQKIVRAADIYNIADEYQEFIDKNITLKVEYESMNNTSVSWDEWKEICSKIINGYLSEELVINDDFELLSIEDAKDNLNSFLEEKADTLESRQTVLFPE